MFTITTNSPEQTSLLGEKIANLIQDNLIIYPGHDGSTTLFDELKRNPYL